MWPVYSNWSQSSLGCTSRFYAVNSQFTYLQLVPAQVKFVQWKRTTQEDEEEKLCFVLFFVKELLKVCKI